MGFRCVGFSSCGTWGLVALRQVGSSRTRAGAHVACIGRWFLKHCTTREATRCQVLLASFKPLDSPKPDFGLLPYKSQRKVLLVLHPIWVGFLPLEVQRVHWLIQFFFFFNIFYILFFYLFIGCIVSLLLRTGFSLWWLLLLQSMGSRCAGFSSCGARALEHRLSAGSVAVAHGLSCSAACGIFPDQGSNPCPLHGRRILNHCATREALANILLRRSTIHQQWHLLCPQP